MALLLHEEFERGTNGTACTSLNTSFGIITGAVNFSSTVSFNGGTLSAKINNNSATNSCYQALPNVTTHYSRHYIYIVSMPTANIDVVYDASGSAMKNTVQIDSATNKVILRDNVAGSFTLGSAGLSSSQWYRFEWDVTGTTQTVRIYTDNNTTPIDTITRSAANVSCDGIRFGTQTAGGGTLTVYWDNVAVDTTTQPGTNSYITDNDSVTCTDAVSTIGPSYSDSFESASTGALNTAPNTVFSSTAGLDATIVSTPTNTGVRSMKSINAGNGGYGSVQLPKFQTNLYARFYFQLGAIQSAATIAAYNKTGLGNQAFLGLDTTGHLSIAGTGTTTATSALSTGTWYRIEWDVVGSTETMRYYLGNSATLIQSISQTMPAGGFDVAAYGNLNVQTNAYVGYFDDIAVSPTSNPGSLLVSVSDAETGAFTEAVNNLLITKSATETGTFTDALTARTLSSAETGTLTDAVSTRATTLTGTETGTFTESQIIATQTLIDGDTFAWRESTGVEQVAKSTWRFTPSRASEIFQMKERATFFVTIGEGVSVLKTAGTYRTVMGPVQEDIAAADIVYLGGRSYAVDDTEKAALIAAGYGAYVALILDPS